MRLRFMGVIRVWALLGIALAMAPTGTVASAAPAVDCDEGLHMDDAVYRICMPATWNGDLLIYAYGYVSPLRPVEIPDEQIKPPGSSLGFDEFATSQGYAFAVSDYGTNGLAVKPGMDHIIDLIDVFTGLERVPEKVILVGFSEGGQIVTLLLEQYPDLFAGGLVACGPYGSFRDQTNYFGDVRTLFDYYFPDVMPPSPVDIPQTLMDTWETSFYTDTVKPVITDPANAATVDEFLTVAGVAFDADRPAVRTTIIENLLWYNVVGTNNGRTVLGGQPYDNQGRLFSGSSDDEALNDEIQRFTADPTALTRMDALYETTGNLSVPLVSLHTTGDPTVPYIQASLYGEKVTRMRRADFYRHFRVDAYGHCTFGALDLLGAVSALQAAIENPPTVPQEVYLPIVLTGDR